MSKIPTMAMIDLHHLLLCTRHVTTSHYIRDFRLANRPFATNNHMVHGGGQADYYSRTGPVKLDLPLLWCPSAGIIMSLPTTMYHVMVCCKRPIHNFFHRKLQNSKLKERLEDVFMLCCYATEKNKIVPHAFVYKEERRTVRKRMKFRKCDHQVASFVTSNTLRKPFSCRQVYQ